MQQRSRMPVERGEECVEPKHWFEKDEYYLDKKRVKTELFVKSQDFRIRIIACSKENNEDGDDVG